MSDYKQVIVMRKDLNMRKGKMIAQGAHAVLKVFLNSSFTSSTKEWLNSGQTKICVSVDSEEELLAKYEAAKSAGLNAALIQDAGHTEFNGVPTYTCIAIGPGESSEIDKITGDLKLL
jgi:PTH2 family peptidyl-tRNA hydrolase